MAAIMAMIVCSGGFFMQEGEKSAPRGGDAPCVCVVRGSGEAGEGCLDAAHGFDDVFVGGCVAEAYVAGRAEGCSVDCGDVALR